VELVKPHHELVASPRASDAERVVRDHYTRDGRLHLGMAQRLGLSVDEATDVVQEAHLRLWLELQRGTAIDDPRAWVARVIYRLAMDEHRLRRRLAELRVRLMARAVQRTPPDPGSEDLWPMVDRLPVRERAALYLRYRADLAYDQIAVVMDITPGAARTYVSRGTHHLRSALERTDR
jgi:RNA polymerase sigma-70 factor (ECF subfamily)